MNRPKIFFIQLIGYIFTIIYKSPTICSGAVLEFRDVHFKFSPKYFYNFTIFIRNATLNTEMDIKKPLEQGFRVVLDFKIRMNNSKKFQSLFKHDLDVCAIVISFKTTMFRRWFNSILKYGNFMDNCPVMPGHYYLYDWRMDPSMVPPYLYAGDYRVRGYGYYGTLKSKKEDFVVDIEVGAKLH